VASIGRQVSSAGVVIFACLGFCLTPIANVSVVAQNMPPSTPAAPSTPAPPKPVVAIDLSAAKTQNWPIDPGTYRIVLYNAIPGVKYIVRSGAAESAEVPTLVFPAASAIAVPAAAGQPSGTGCPTALERVKQLFTASNERDVPKLQQEIRANMSGCTPEQTTAINAALAQTVYESGLEIQMPNDARRTVTASRGVEEWNVTLMTLLRGRIQTLFGWTFAPNNDEEFFSEAAPNNQFTIRPKTESDGGFTNLPSVFFTWLPSAQAFKDIQQGPALGLGVSVGDTAARPSFLGGWMVRWNQNLGVVAGAAIYPHRRLNGKYKPDQVISTNLDTAQLNENDWRLNFFFGGVFRFGSDPRKAASPPSTGK
jgi:hypothetical protein